MLFHATPYDPTYAGFYFEDGEEFETFAEAYKRSYGVEEYEIQLIESSHDEAQLISEIGINQGNIQEVIDFMDTLDGQQRAGAAFMLSHNGETFDSIKDNSPSDFDEPICYATGEFRSEERLLEEYAEEYVESTGMLDGVPETVARYFDFEAFGRDMAIGGDVTVFEFAGTMYVMSNHV